jgi:hypothetical protein
MFSSSSFENDLPFVSKETVLCVCTQAAVCVHLAMSGLLVSICSLESATIIVSPRPGTCRSHNIRNILYKLVLNFYLEFTSSMLGLSRLSSSSNHQKRLRNGCTKNVYSCIWRGRWFCNLGHTYPHHCSIVWPSTADILVMENTVSLYASKYCTTWMCSIKKPIYYDQILFQLHRSKQGSSEISEQWYIAVLMWPSYFIYQHKYQQTSTDIQDYGVFRYG